MALTPMDIHNKDFSRSFRGYQEEEVDRFLDEVVATFEQLYRDNSDMKDRITSMMEQMEYFKAMEAILKETLVTAQRAADELVEKAHGKAAGILEEAEVEARHIVEEAKNQHQRMMEEANGELEAMESRQRSLEEKLYRYHLSMKDMLELQLETLKQSQKRMEQMNEFPVSTEEEVDTGAFVSEPGQPVHLEMPGEE